ncbi:MAG: MBL fold metallo-hydrolase [Oscillospiraceae bacterium]|jgi:ribonuclease/clavin/mitogillin
MLETGSYNGVNFAKEVCFTGENETKVFIYNVDGLLIDCGPQSRAEQFIPWMKEQEIKQVALTHNHEDHSGNAKWIRDELKIPVYLHPLAIPLTRERGAYPLYRQEMWGHREVFDATPMPEKLKTDKYAFDVIDSPGHALYHKCFHEANQKWLFTGDLYLGTRLLVCFIEENMRQTISTIERLMDLDFDTIFCAHAGVIENGKVRLGKKLRNLKELQAQVLEMRAGGKTDEEIDAEINGFDLDITNISCGEWSTYNIIRTL